LHTAFDRSSGTLGTVGGGAWGRCIDWQRPWRPTQQQVQSRH